MDGSSVKPTCNNKFCFKSFLAESAFRLCTQTLTTAAVNATTAAVQEAFINATGLKQDTKTQINSSEEDTDILEKLCRKVESLTKEVQSLKSEIEQIRK